MVCTEYTHLHMHTCTQGAPLQPPQHIAAIIQAMHDSIPALWSAVVAATGDDEQGRDAPPPPWRMDLQGITEQPTTSIASASAQTTRSGKHLLSSTPKATPKTTLDQRKRPKVSPKYVDSAWVVVMRGCVVHGSVLYYCIVCTLSWRFVKTPHSPLYSSLHMLPYWSTPQGA